MKTTRAGNNKIIQSFIREENEDFLQFMHQEIFSVFQKYNVIQYNDFVKVVLQQYNRIKFLKNHCSDPSRNNDVICLLCEMHIGANEPGIKSFTIQEFLGFANKIKTDKNHILHKRAEKLNDKFTYEVIQTLNYLGLINLNRRIGSVEKEIRLTTALLSIYEDKNDWMKTKENLIQEACSRFRDDLVFFRFINDVEIKYGTNSDALEEYHNHKEGQVEEILRRLEK